MDGRVILGPVLNGTYLIVITLAAICVLLALILAVRVHAFLALFITGVSGICILLFAQLWL